MTTIPIDQLAVKRMIQRNRYDEAVINGIQKAIIETTTDKTMLLRLRMDGVDLIITNDIGFAKEKFKRTMAEWYIVNPV